jgi:hypothetical protein
MCELCAGVYKNPISIAVSLSPRGMPCILFSRLLGTFQSGLGDPLCCLFPVVRFLGRPEKIPSSPISLEYNSLA